MIKIDPNLILRLILKQKICLLYFYLEFIEVSGATRLSRSGETYST